MKRDLGRLEAELKHHRQDAERLGRDLGQFRKRQDEEAAPVAELQRLKQSRYEADKMIASLENVIADLESSLAQYQRTAAR
jgi:prefoldin subunit 5